MVKVALDVAMAAAMVVVMAVVMVGTMVEKSEVAMAVAMEAVATLVLARAAGKWHTAPRRGPSPTAVSSDQDAWSPAMGSLS